VRSRKLALVIAPFLLLSLLPGVAAAAQPEDTKAAHHAKVVKYWTPERIKNAKPRDFVFDPAGGTYKPAAKPAPPSGGGAVTGASWTGAGDILNGTGRVLFTLGGSDYICSGSVVREVTENTEQSIVLTAGHCASENDGTTVATNWMFIPSFDTAPSYTCGQTTYGCWVADAIYGDKTFLNAGGFNDTAVQHDWSFAVVSTGGKTATSTLQLDATVGVRFPIGFSGVSKGDTLSAFGYPAAGRYHGKDLTYCRGTIGEDANADNSTWSMACNMTGGSSGGPWVSTTNTATYDDAVTTLRSLNSYGYSGISNMYGPKFNTTYTQVVFGAADAFSTPGSGSSYFKITNIGSPE
jgi:hypothetical protein